MGILKQKLHSLHAFERRIIRRQGLAGDMANGVDYNIFTVTGGVMIHFMFGHVTTVIGATANLIRLDWTPTVAGAVVPLCLASASIAADAVNTLYVWSGALANQLVPGAAIGQSPTDECPWAGEAILLPDGIINVDNPTGANTGVIDWYILYSPCSEDSVITVL